INGMSIRGGTLTTDSVWDDSDIVHVVTTPITAGNNLTVRLQSTATQSLVVKLQGGAAGLNASGTPSDITGRIGGTVQILGQPGHPVVLTSLNDSTVGAGLTPNDRPDNNTAQAAGSAASPGDWQGVKIDEYANDNNVSVSNEAEAAYTGGNDTNGTPQTAEALGGLAPNQQSGDDNLRLGFQVNGFISPNDTHDVDTYSFTAKPGTQVWVDVGHTSPALDSVVELIDANGNVLARSDNSVAEQEDAVKNGNPLAAGPLLSGLLPGNLALPMQSSTFQQNTYPGPDLRDIGTTNPQDAGMRLVLPGTPDPSGAPTTYYVRIYSKGPVNGDGTPNALTYQVTNGKSNGLSSGAYQLQVRLQEQWETPGTVVRFSDIRYATNGITVLGQPAHSPLLGDSASNGTNSITIPVASGAPGVNQPQYDPGVQPNNFQSAQDLGNLATSDSGSLSVAGNLNAPGQVDWYKFSLNFNLMQAIQGVNAADKTLSTIFHIGYADGLQGRPDTTISVYDQWGNLVYVGRDSNVADEQPRPTQGNDLTNLSHGSFGTGDPYIGPVQMPAGVPGGTVPTTNGRVSPGSAAYPLDPSTYPMPLQTINNYNGPNSYTYFVAVSSNATLPTALDATFNAGSANPLVRLEPIDGIQRVVEDHVGNTGYNSNDGSAPLGNGTNLNPQDGPILPVGTSSDILQHVVPWNLNNVVLYANTPGALYAVNPANGAIEPHFNGTATNPYIVTPLPNGLLGSKVEPGDTEDIAMRTDGNLFAYQSDLSTDGDSGEYYQVDTTTGATVDLGGDGAAGAWKTQKKVDALAFIRTGQDAYKLFFSARKGTQSELLYANTSTGDTTTVPPFGDLGPMYTGPSSNSVSGAQIKPGDNFSITDYANRTVLFVFEPTVVGNTFIPNTPAGDAGTYYIAYSTTDPSFQVNFEVENAIDDAFQNQLPPPNPRPAGFVETDATIGLFGNGLQINNAANIDGANAPEFNFNNAPGGFVTGMAYDPSTNLFYAVSDRGGVYSMRVSPNFLPIPTSIQYLGSSSVFTQRGYHFEGLTLGPQNVDWNGDGTGGDLQDVLFATAEVYDNPANPQSGHHSVLTAITDSPLGANNIFSVNAIGAGGPVAVFDQTVADATGNPQTTGDYQDNVSLGGLQDVRGVAMSVLDFNMWHVAPSVNGDGGAINLPGHGVNGSPQPLPVNVAGPGGLSGPGDNSRVDNTTSSNAFYFGLDNHSPGVEAPSGLVKDLVHGTTNSLDNAVNNNKTFNAPGDVYGSLMTSPFSLAGYSSGDKPTVYFDYYLNTGMSNNSSANWDASARVYISPDGGKSWDEIATNNPARTRYFPSNDPGGTSLARRQFGVEQPLNTSELPDFATASSDVPASQTQVDPRQQVQQLFDSTGTWRQARIDLSNYAGNPNLMLRFDFSGTHGFGQLTAFKTEAGSGNPIPGETGNNSDLGGAPKEGWYVSDLVVGLAGRGEMVTNAPIGQTQFFTTPQNPFFGSSTEILTGPYQLDIQRGADTGQTINPNRSNILVDPNQLDINDRLTSAYTLIAPEGHFNQSLTQVPGSAGLGPTSNVLPAYTYSFTNVPAPTAGGTLTISAVGDLEGSYEYLTASFPDLPANDPLNTANIPVFFNQQDKSLQGQFSTSAQISLTQAQLQQLLAAGLAKHNANVITITLTPLANASPTVTPGNPPNPLGSVQTSGPSLVNHINMLAVTLDFGIAGSFDGQTFTISDGVHQRVFELDSNNQLNNPSNVRVTILPSYTGAQIAQAMVAAINQNGLLNVQAATSDANNNNPLASATPNDDSDRVNLFGAASVVVGTPQQVISGPNPANSASAPVPPHSSIATAFPTGLDSGNDPNLKPITSGGAGSLSANVTYYYVVSATDANGLNAVSNEQPYTATSGNGSASLYWAPLPGATVYNIYRGTAPGQENVLIGAIGGGSSAYTGPTSFTDSGAAGATAAPPPVTRVFNGYGVIGNAAGVGTSPQVDLMKVHLHAGDSMTIDLNTQSILSTLDPTLRLFDRNGMELTSLLQDGAQSPFGSLNVSGAGSRQFNPATGANYYLSPPVGQPGHEADLYYTFTAPSTVAAPTLQSVSLSAGGSLGVGSYYYVVTALVGGGETTASNLQSVSTNAANQTARLSWSQTLNATGYKIYRGTSPGQQNQLVAVINNGRTTSFADAGGLTSATPPATNTAGLSAPALQAVTPQTTGSLVPGTYDYVITAVNAQGETLASNELQGTANPLDASMQLTWSPVSGATSYNIYRGTASGQENALIAAVPAGNPQAQQTFVDDGTESAISASPPSASTAQADGDYYIGVSGQGNGAYDPNGDGRERGSTGYYQIQVSAGPINLRGASGVPGSNFFRQGDPFGGFVFLRSNQNVPPDNTVNIGTLFYRAPNQNGAVGANDTTVRVVKYDNLIGDTQTPRKQGAIILESNQVSKSLNDGILVSAAPREGLPGSPDPNLPHQGAVRNLPVLDTARLVPGPVIKNNIVSGYGNAGIQFSGDPNAQNPLAAVPFGRIANNTVYGGVNPSGAGILVTNSASPTIMNNIVANSTTGISIDASSQGLTSPPVLAANIYQGNTTNTNLPSGNLGTNGIALAPTDPLFVNAPANNFYLQEFSQAIDSSIDVLQDRAAMTQVTAPLGIAPSPIVAPATDINGQLRVDDPLVNSPPGLGGQVFKDRGAVERADTLGPAASLLTPADNDLADQDPRVNVVHPVGENLSEFDILLNDGIGSGVDNSTVTQNRVTVRRNGVLLTPGIDYAFVYDNNNHIIRLIAASGVWQNGNVYDIALDNGKKFDPQDPTLGPQQGDLGITDLAGNSLQANAASGYTTYQMILDSVANDAPSVVLPTTQQTMFEHEAIRFAPASVTDTDAPESATDPDSASGSDPYLDIPGAAIKGITLPPGDGDWDLNNPITIYDVDANGGIEQVTITASVGTLSILQDANTPSVNVVQISGNGTPANPLVLRGPLGDLVTDANGNYVDPGINTALAHLVFRLDDSNNPNAYYFNGTANLTIVASDLGNTPPPARITTVNLPITVTPVNDAPSEVVPSPTDTDTVRSNPIEAANATSGFMDFPAASALTGSAGTNSGLTFQVFDTAGNTATNFKFANVFEVDVAGTATGHTIAHQTITVTRNGVRKTFEFTTPTTGPAAAGNVPIAVNDNDTPGNIAAAAAKAVGSVSGFNAPALGTSINNRLLINATTGLSASDSLLSVKNAWWEIDVAATATGQAIYHQTFTVTQGTTSKTFEFANPWEVDVASNATGKTVAHGTLTVTQNGTSKTFEFITPTTGSITPGNIAVSVQDTDGPAQLAAAVAAVINGPNGFNIAGLAQANPAGTAASTGAMVITSSTSVGGTGAGTLLTLQTPQTTNPSNIPVVVRSTDGAAQIAVAAVAAVDGANGFNTPALATVSPSQSNQVLIATSATLAGSDTLLSIYNPVPYLATDGAAAVAQDVVAAINAIVPTKPASVQSGSARVVLTGSAKFTAAPVKQPANPSSEDTPYVFSQANGNAITISDPDISGTDVNNAALQFTESVSLLSGSGTLHVQNTSGITFINGSANDTATLQFQGTLAGINAALEGLAFDPTNEFVGPVHLTFLTNDNGNIGYGPAPLHQAPVVPLSSPLEDVYLAIYGSQDHPALDTTVPMTLTAINEQPTNPPTPALPATPNTGNTVYSILQTGANGGNQTAMTLIGSGAKYGIAVTGLTVPVMPSGTPGGAWQYSLDGGKTWQNIAPGPNNGVGLAPPAGLAASPTVGGTLATNTTYHYVVTAVDAQGETGAGSEAVAATSLVQRTIALSWNAVNGATSYKIYRGSSAGGENVLVGSVLAGATTFNDDGSESTTTQTNAHLQPPASVTATAATGGALAANTTYFYVVTAVNALGETTVSSETTGTTTATKLTQNLAWIPVNGALGYRIYRGTTSGAENVLIGAIGSGATTTFTDDGTETTAPVVSLRNALLLDGGTGAAPNLGDLVRFNPAKDFNSAAFGSPAIHFIAWDQTAALNPNTNAVVALSHGNLVDLDSSDGNGLGTGGSTPFSPYDVNALGVASITVNAVNDAPTITVPGAPFQALEGQPFVFSSKNGTNPVVTDFDDGEGNGINRGQVLVTIATDPSQGTLMLGSTAGLTSVAGNGSAQITLQGPLAIVNQDLDGLSFIPAPNFAGAANITFQADDLGNAGLGGDQVSAQVTAQVSFTAQHQAPQLYPTGDGVAPATGQPHFASVLQNTPAQSNSGSLVGDMLTSLNPYDIYHDGRPTGNVSPTAYPPFLDLDADAGAKQGIAVVSVAGNGIWQYSLDGGGSWVSISPTSVSTANALLLPGPSGPGAPGALVRFLPAQNYTDSTGAVNMKFFAWDQTDGAAAGSHVNLSGGGATGGATAYSSGT
ncbi:MAG TPA: right-handed parallel beta-helix repeat-containing protein, partial [Pirellulales bacterium]|nr:right-handed parallel beta-helix repeat-containing protein [Pirellulales bacterium]